MAARRSRPSPLSPLARRSRLRPGPGSILGLFVLLGGLPAVAQSGEGVGPGLRPAVLVQESNGFPGGEKTTRLSRQTVTVAGDRLRILDPVHRWALFIDLHERTVHEADVEAQEYVRKSFDDYAKYRTERQQNLEERRQEFLRGLERREGRPQALREWIDTYRRGGGDPDQPGRIVAKLQYYPQDVRGTTILVDREERKVTLQHYVIRENQCDRPVLDLWVTLDVELPVRLQRFYRELGTFSPEVSAKLREVQGAILEYEAVLDTGSLSRTFRSRILEVRTSEPPTTLSVPAGWKPAAPKAAPKPAVRSCEVCAKALGEGEGESWRAPSGARTIHWACSKEHLRTVMQKVIARQKRSKSGG